MEREDAIENAVRGLAVSERILDEACMQERSARGTTREDSGRLANVTLDGGAVQAQVGVCGGG